MTHFRLPQLRGLPIVVVAATVAVMGIVNVLAPASGAMKAARIDRSGPDNFEGGDLSWPRTLIDFDGYPVRIHGPAKRVISQYWSIDEFVYSVVPASHVAGVSESAYLERVSNIFEQVDRFKPVIATDPERVLRADPDLIIVSSSARVDFTALMRSTGIPIYRLATTFTTLEQLGSTIRLMGYLTGIDDAAEREYQRFREAVEAARKRKPGGVTSPRILGFGGRYSYGDQTLFHDIVETLGGINVGAEGGLHGYSSVSTEQILRWDPEWIVAGAEAGKEEQVRTRLLDDPAIALTQAARKQQILIYDQRMFLPMSPFTARILKELGEDLYGD